jgi:hypothetical protein
MEKLNLPGYSFRIKSALQRNLIFDEIRKKYVPLTPEEWVRQHFIHYLIAEKNYPRSHISVELNLKLNKLNKRCDIVIFNNQGAAQLIVECKSPSVQITQNVFDQIAVYNLKLSVKYLIVTNGMNHYCCVIDKSGNSYRFISEIPDYKNM